MSGIQNLTTFDPFADASGHDEGSTSQNLIHIRVQQRNGRKTLTTVQGIPTKFDLKKIVRQCKKDFNCNGTVVEHVEYGEVIQLQGDWRLKTRDFLIEHELASVDNVKVHGF